MVAWRKILVSCVSWLLLVLVTTQQAGGDTAPGDRHSADAAAKKDVSAKKEPALKSEAVPKKPSNTATKKAPADSPQKDEHTPVANEALVRLREGAKLVDQIGEFQKSGERYNFYPQTAKGVIRVLENLALERVASMLVDDPSPRLWNVSGMVTEFRGENYLLITKAVLKPRGVGATNASPASVAKAVTESSPAQHEK